MILKKFKRSHQVSTKSELTKHFEKCTDKTHAYPDHDHFAYLKRQTFLLELNQIICELLITNLCKKNSLIVNKTLLVFHRLLVEGHKQFFVYCFNYPFKTLFASVLKYTNPKTNKVVYTNQFIRDYSKVLSKMFLVYNVSRISPSHDLDSNIVNSSYRNCHSSKICKEVPSYQDLLDSIFNLKDKKSNLKNNQKKKNLDELFSSGNNHSHSTNLSTVFPLNGNNNNLTTNQPQEMKMKNINQKKNEIKKVFNNININENNKKNININKKGQGNVNGFEERGKSKDNVEKTENGERGEVRIKTPNDPLNLSQFFPSKNSKPNKTPTTIKKNQSWNWQDIDFDFSNPMELNSEQLPMNSTNETNETNETNQQSSLPETNNPETQEINKNNTSFASNTSQFQQFVDFSQFVKK
ncbi:phosphatidylinositol-binding clathrin assembly protein lap [Anaeramoeba flamelloides]|uniref:Phosphatidylinositol-binding clathrin assembly protein lap n=1 Tax=Anaeramoeba flamelloides TaxID=1746091 RepID=A0AAV8A2P1_9EUKA|nr:phosphatidylinositol-binding clathrin assembly protein lap [Anaeramoeba flamelloides]